MSNLLELDIEFWFFTAPIALGLAVFGWYGPKWLGRFRWVALGVAMQWQYRLLSLGCT